MWLVNGCADRGIFRGKFGIEGTGSAVCGRCRVFLLELCREDIDFIGTSGRLPPGNVLDCVEAGISGRSAESDFIGTSVLFLMVRGEGEIESVWAVLGRPENCWLSDKIGIAP
jgi:hypothetical protein